MKELTSFRQPIKRGRHIILDSCGSDGLLRRQICSKSLPKVLYRSARKSKWGDIYDTKTYVSFSSEDSIFRLSFYPLKFVTASQPLRSIRNERRRTKATLESIERGRQKEKENQKYVPSLLCD